MLTISIGDLLISDTAVIFSLVFVYLTNLMVWGSRRKKCYNVVDHCKISSCVEKELKIYSYFQVGKFFLN